MDTDARIIVDVETTPGHRTQKVWSTKALVERFQVRFNLKAQKLMVDAAFGTAKFLSWMIEERGIEPHVPVC